MRNSIDEISCTQRCHPGTLASSEPTATASVFSTMTAKKMPSRTLRSFMRAANAIASICDLSPISLSAISPVLSIKGQTAFSMFSKAIVYPPAILILVPIENIKHVYLMGLIYAVFDKYFIIFIIGISIILPPNNIFFAL